LAIASRADPALPLARLRGRGELVEIRAADLRFTPDEAAAYLTEAMGLALTGPDVTALEGRTEGWIAALQLAALSMQGRDDIAGFIAGFAGDDRYIVDYLVEEVFAAAARTRPQLPVADLHPGPAERPPVRDETTGEARPPRRRCRCGASTS
jgi:ATP/maltotriose-dependent transcriptional regulator MalT